MTVKLEHANITVQSIEASTKLLGAAFPEFSKRGEGHMHGDAALGTWVHFGTDATYLAFQQNRVHSGRADVTYTNDGINHVGFVVSGLEALMQRLLIAGFTPSSVEMDHPHRNRVYYTDDNQLEWEFVEYTSEQPEERNDYSH